MKQYCEHLPPKEGSCSKQGKIMMYAYIRGHLVKATSTYAVVDVSGIGYHIYTPSSTMSKLPDIGSLVVLHTTFIVREGFQGLYGFFIEEERDLFNEVIEISGIGPKIGLAMISHLSIADLHDVILREDTNALSKVPGIGKKTAERLLVELRNRLDKFFLKTALPEAGSTNLKQQNHQDALKALIHLGYNRTAAQKALKKSLASDEDLALEELISRSLKHF